MCRRSSSARDIAGAGVVLCRAGRRDLQRQFRGADLRPFREQHGALDDVLQLAHVARPRISAKHVECVGGEHGRIGTAELLEEAPREQWNVRPPDRAVPEARSRWC
jgi:hypothetical protein